MWVILKVVVAIPGTKRIKYLEENLAANVRLSAEKIVPLGVSTGDRYDAASMAGIDR